jgi:hypothetical protein
MPPWVYIMWSLCASTDSDASRSCPQYSHRKAARTSAAISALSLIQPTRASFSITDSSSTTRCSCFAMFLHSSSSTSTNVKVRSRLLWAATGVYGKETYPDEVTHKRVVLPKQAVLAVWIAVVFFSVICWSNMNRAYGNTYERAYDQ